MTEGLSKLDKKRFAIEEYTSSRKISKNIDDLTDKFLLIKNNQASKLEKDLFYFTVLPMIQEHTAKYKKFSNYADLNQFGFEAALTGLHSYDPKKGSLSCWLAYYIKTKVKRKASQHASLRIPLKRMKEENSKKPIKTDEIPVQIDFINPEALLQKKESQEKLQNIIYNFSNLEKMILMYHFKLDNQLYGIQQFRKQNGISKLKYQDILDKCLKKIRRECKFYKLKYQDIIDNYIK